MQMRIVVETEEEYNKWLAEQKTFKETVMVDDTEGAEVAETEPNAEEMETASVE